MLDLQKVTSEKILLFDGAMGTMLQQRGLKTGELPERVNITRPEIVTEIHREYVLAGADVVSSNTFGSSALKLGNESEVQAVIEAGVRCAKESGAKYAALDIGPLGQLMEPAGAMSFERAYELFRQQVAAGEKAGADIIIIETFQDPYEAKAAILAAKENTSLPVICSLTFQEDGRTFSGCDALTATLFLQGLNVDALGVNCSLGPNLLAPIVETMLKYARVPVIMQANAGLPVMRGDKTVYELDAETYVRQVMELVEKGVRIVGGCCGTSPEHIRLLKEKISGMAPVVPTPERVTACTSGSKTVVFGDGAVEIGERLNPTGKQKLKNALKTGDMDCIIGEALAQVDAGSQVLDVNAGLPEIDEAAVLVKVVRTVQGVTGVPLMLDSSNAGAVEAAARIYNGLPIINSVNGKKEILERILPVAKKYGALVVGLALDENGIPETSRARLEIAGRIRDAAASYAIPPENLLIDCLALTASTQQEQAIETLTALRLMESELGLKTVLGVSNISFGLPERETINATFLALALGAGLSSAIVNPLSESLRNVWDAYRVLNNEDKNSEKYIAKHAVKAENTVSATPATGRDLSLSEIIGQGRVGAAAEKVKTLLETMPPLEIIDKEFIPALNLAGKRFESGEIFLPQLMLTAQAVQAGFEALREKAGGESVLRTKGRILLATVHGDVHDIGKNIVKMLLENYGYEVLDLGKDVAPDEIIRTIREKDIRLAGLSALMTTTVASMRETIKAVREAGLDCAFIAGGAVLTEEYAKNAGADYYAKDAMEGVMIAERFFGERAE